ncbi:MAG: STAS domain-containing protein [Magnetococcales bacterium]|nr:STAS domain-containing protein [Magnetococcales bacterium]NGZ27673.1 STAS domain-containing protein [Magnetococcales bacterium]
MPVQLDQGNLVLEGECNIDTAEALREHLLSLLQQGQSPIVVKTEAMTTVDVSVLQVFLAARVSLRQRGGQLIIQSSPLLTRLLHDAGLPDAALFS